MASTSRAILVLCDGTVFAANVLVLTFESVSVTGGAKRLVLGKRPGNSCADNRSMAGVTAGIFTVIARVVPVGVMTEAGWRPAIGGMTHVALCSGV